MRRRERLALVIVLLIVIGLPVAVLGYEYGLRGALAPRRVVEVIAAVPEAGGFQPASITVSTGETVTLRFTSPDVTHGVAMGPGLGIDLGPIDPGHVVETTLTFDRAGTYTFYCNIWCSPNHWRMRGIVEVSSPDQPAPTPQRDPVIEALATEGVDIDANVDHGPDHDMSAAMMFPLDRRPSAQRGELIAKTVTIPAEVNNLNWRRSHTPAQALDLLTAANPTLRRTDAIDATAYVWVGTLLPQHSTLYDKNCTACHGQTGDGKGPMAALTAKKPVAFADPSYMFNMRSDVLYAKIRRGGMGTDMPNFGTVFTPEETWSLVDYLWTLSFTP
jgi:plastocyanin/mono/diheme cytochrome c family protein